MRGIQYIRSVMFAITFLLILCVFHIIHLITLRLDQRMYRRGFRSMNDWITWALRWCGGVRFTCEVLPELPANRPVVIVANHQSMFDISTIVHLFRQHDVRFIAKRELSRGLPSVSLCLRRGGHLLIDRDRGREALRAIKAFAGIVGESNGTVCIFPEGTRARDGKMGSFKSAGLQIMLSSLPGATLVPLALANSWRIVQHRLLPIPAGVHVRCGPLTPLTVPERVDAEFVQKLEASIRSELARLEGLA